MTEKKRLKKSSGAKDYLRLPFEVYYSGPLTYTSLELMSTKEKIKKPHDFDGLLLEQGRAYGVTFAAANKTGSELYCCMTGSHSDAKPDWLEMIEEEDLNINHGQINSVRIDEDGVDLCCECEDSSMLEGTGFSTSYYSLEDENPDYIILDAEGDRIKIDYEGYLLDGNDDLDDEHRKRIIDLDSAVEGQAVTDFVTKDHQEVQDQWIRSVWEECFPRLRSVKIKRYA